MVAGAVMVSEIIRRVTKANVYP